MAGMTSSISQALLAPLSFRPCYQSVVWGGRRMEQWRDDLPEGPIGESWDISQQERGMSVVAEGPLSERTLASLMEEAGAELVGSVYDGGDFPLLIKLLDARQRLSVQVHPDDELAQRFKVGQRGKTECWYIIGDGGELFQGTKPGMDAEQFRVAISSNEVEPCLNRFETTDGEFYFMPARTLHALGTNTLLYEIQQSCDCTFRVYDWGRMGLDGKPRQLHIEESLATIDFDGGEVGARPGETSEHALGGTVRTLVDCPYFSVEERQASATGGGDTERCSVVICLSGSGTLKTEGGALTMQPMRSYLVPAVAGAWQAKGEGGGDLRLLVARPN